jgi:hypothetical protein
MDDKLEKIQIGDQVYVEEGADPCGGVRGLAPETRSGIVIHVENAGEFTVSMDAVRSVHDGKVVLDRSWLDQPLLDAIAHAHDSEVPGL